MAIDVNSASWSVGYFPAAKHPELKMKEFPLLKSVVECASMCLIEIDCLGFTFDPKCNLYFCLSIEEVQNDDKIGYVAIKVLPMRLKQVRVSRLVKTFVNKLTFDAHTVIITFTSRVVLRYLALLQPPLLQLLALLPILHLE